LSNSLRRAASYRVSTPDAKIFLLLKLFLFLLLFQAGCAPYLVVSGGAVNQAKLQEIKAGLALLRGLEFKRDVPVEIESREEMRKHLERDLEEEYGGEKLQNLSLAYAKLGLFPEGLDLKKSLLDFYTAQVAAFYDPKTKKLVLPEDWAGGILLGAVQFLARRDIMGEMVLAHELTHALQDQHFSLEDRLRSSDNDDRTLAFHAVAEGDATLSGFGYLFGIDDQSLDLVDHTVQESIQEARSSLSDIPEAIIEELLFQYYGGVSFVSRVVRERGWSGVNRLYSYPPLSTEQVLHPEKYLDSPDPPTGIKLDDLSALFESDWREIENNVLGELMVRVLFRRFLSPEEAKTIANGWDGDRFVAFQRGKEVAFAWATAWDSAADAKEFFDGYQKLLGKKYGGSGNDAARVHIEQQGQRVLVIEGLEGAYVKEHVEKIWQRMELKKGAPPGGPS